MTIEVRTAVGRDIALPLTVGPSEAAHVSTEASPVLPPARDVPEPRQVTAIEWAVLVATVLPAVDSVVNDSVEDASRSLSTTLVLVLAWWLWTSGWRPGSK
jgi:hypothetical protein